MNLKIALAILFYRYYFVFGQTTQGIVINNVALPYHSETIATELSTPNLTHSIMERPLRKSDEIKQDHASLEEQFFWHIVQQENITFDGNETVEIQPPPSDYEDSIFNSESSTPWNNFENTQAALHHFNQIEDTTTASPSTVESALTPPKIRQPTYSPPIVVSHRNTDLLKQLKMQFVLDCSLLDEKSQTRVPVSIVDILKTKESPATVTRPSITTTTQRPAAMQPIVQYYQPFKKSNKAKVVVQKVDDFAPAISDIGDYFEKIYNYLEDAFTTKIVEKKLPKQTNNYTPMPYRTTRRLINHNRHGARPYNRLPQSLVTKLNAQQRKPNAKRPTRYRPKRTTFPPNSRSTRKSSSHNFVGGGQHKKNYMNTQIHVTSEYNGPSPTSSIENSDLIRQSLKDSSEEGGDVFYDGFSIDDLVDGGGDDDDDDSSDDSAEDDYDDDDDYPLPTDKRKLRKRKNSKMGGLKRRPIDDDDSYEDVQDGFDLPSGMFSGFFSNFFSSIGNMMPSFRWFTGAASKPGVEQEEARSTTPRIDMRRPKQPNVYSELDNAIGDDTIQQPDDGAFDSFGDGWFNPFSGVSSEMDEYTSPMTPVTESSSDYWNWFGSGEQQTVEPTTMKQNETGWFFGLFDNPTTEPTTTRRPFLTIANPLQNPQAWLGILAQHLSTTTTRKPVPQTAASKRTSYENYQMWRILPSTEGQVEFLEDYRSTPEGAKLQWWKGPTLRGPTDIIVPPSVIADVKESLQYEEIPYEVIIWDVEKAIMYENPKQTNLDKIELTRRQGHPLSWHRYHRYDDIVKFLDYMQQQYSNVVELIHIGRSFEGRPLTIAKISAEDIPFVNWKDERPPNYDSKKRKSQKPAVFIEAGTHAREWIAPAAATWILNNLVKYIERNDSLGETVRSVDWYIMPVLNPDGYEYSHEYNRLWRKTRSKHSDESESLFNVAMNWIRKDKSKEVDSCFGTDPNRNWNNMWSEKGSSRSACSDFYAGPKAFSEPETKAVSKFLMENKKYFKLFLALHSYGQLISYPTTANASYNSMKSDDSLEMAQVAVESLRASGSSARYNIDSSNEMLFARSGSSDAFAMYDAGVKYSYTLELRDTGTHGFLLPPSYIEATAKDAFEIVRGMIDYI